MDIVKSRSGAGLPTSPKCLSKGRMYDGEALRPDEWFGQETGPES